MNRIFLAACLLAALALPSAAEETNLWQDDLPEVVLGVYFDEAGTDTLLEGSVPDTLTVHLIMWNGGNRSEGDIRALEYMIGVPEGLMLLSNVLPDYSNLSMGTITTGFTQAVNSQSGDGLRIATITLVRTGEIAYDAEIEVLPNPQSGFLRYVHQWGSGASNVAMHAMVAQNAIVNPKLTEKSWQPVRKGRNR